MALSLTLRMCGDFQTFFHWWALSDILHLMSRHARSGSIPYASIRLQLAILERCSSFIMM